MKRVIVLGAGVVGLATAYALARRGYAVTVIDGAPGPGVGGASFGNGAQLSYAYTDALASPSLRRQLPKLLLGRDPAFRLRLQPSAPFVLWGLELLRNTTQRMYEENTLAVLELALESRAALEGLMTKHTIAFSFRRSAKAHLYCDEKVFEKARKSIKLKQSLGVDQESLSPGEAMEREPALRYYKGTLVGAVWSPHEQVGDSHLFCQGLAEILAADYGVSFMYGTSVERLKVVTGRVSALVTNSEEIPATTVVVALGSSTPALLATAGIRVPIWPLQGYSVTLPATDETPDVSITDTANKVVFCRLGDRVRIAGLADIGRMSPAFRQSRLDDLVRSARAAFPSAADYEADHRAWTGLRPMTPSSRPIIGESRIAGVFMNCGQGMLGWTSAMGSGERLSRIIEGRGRVVPA